MKPLITAVCILVSLHAFTQRIKTSEYDKFVKKYRIETNDIAVKEGMANALSFRIRSIDTLIFIIVSGYGKAADVIGKNDEMIFLFDDDSTSSAYSTGIQDYNIGQYTRSYEHQYSISYDNVVLLSEKKAKSVRQYAANGYVDTDIKDANSLKLMVLAKMFLSEYDNKIRQTSK